MPLVYESPDGGKTVFAREWGSKSRSVLYMGKAYDLQWIAETHARLEREETLRQQNSTLADAYDIYRELLALEESKTNGTNI